MVIDKTPYGERAFDIFQGYTRRNNFLGGPISDEIANLIIAQLLYLEYNNPEKILSFILILLEVRFLELWQFTTL